MTESFWNFLLIGNLIIFCYILGAVFEDNSRYPIDVSGKNVGGYLRLYDK